MDQLASNEFKSNFTPISVKDLLSRTDKEIRWLWENIVPEGILFILAGYPKTGKSVFLSQLAVAVAQGKDFLGLKTKQKGVLVLALEEPAQHVRERLHNFGVQGETDPIFVHDIHKGVLNNSDDTIQDLHSFISDKNIGLMLVDTLSFFWGVESENNNAEVLRALKPLVVLAHETNCSIGLIHHTSKRRKGGAKDIRGASAIFGSVDQALLLDHKRGGTTTQRVLKIDGRYKSYGPDKLIIDFQNERYVCLGTEKEIGFKMKKDEILKIISESHTGITEKEIIEQSGFNRTPVLKVLKALKKENKTKSHGTGKKGDPLKYTVA